MEPRSKAGRLGWCGKREGIYDTIANNDHEYLSNAYAS